MAISPEIEITPLWFFCPRCQKGMLALLVPPAWCNAEYHCSRCQKRYRDYNFYYLADTFCVVVVLCFLAIVLCLYLFVPHSL